MNGKGFFVTRRTLAIGVAAGACFRFVGTALSQTAQLEESVGRRLLASAPKIGERSLGSPNAPVVVIEYASLTCPHCGQFHIRSWPQIRDEYVQTGKVRWIFREFPLDSLAMAAFMLARCMPHDRYVATIDVLFRTQKLWMGPDSRKELARTMQAAGMNRDAFDVCMGREDLAEAIYDIAKTAQTEFDVKSTPTFFVNGQRVRGAQEFAFFKTLLDAELAKASRRTDR